MITVAHTAEYPFPAARVFATIADLSGHPSWQRDVIEVARQDTAAVQLGTRIVQTRKIMGRRTEVDLSVTGYRAGEELRLQTAPGGRPGVVQSYTVRATGEAASLVEFRLDIDGVPKLAEHLAKVQLGKQVPAMFAQLGKVLAEG